MLCSSRKRRDAGPVLLPSGPCVRQGCFYLENDPDDFRRRGKPAGILINEFPQTPFATGGWAGSAQAYVAQVAKPARSQESAAPSGRFGNLRYAGLRNIS
jgi:hypothetical protein